MHIDQLGVDTLALAVSAISLVVSIASAQKQAQYSRKTIEPLCDFTLDIDGTTLQLSLKNEGQGGMYVVSIGYYLGDDQRASVDLGAFVGASRGLSHHRVRNCDHSWIHAIGGFLLLDVEAETVRDLVSLCRRLREVRMRVTYRDMYGKAFEERYPLTDICDRYISRSFDGQAKAG